MPTALVSAGARRSAFTLIELLVVIAIIALLISILLPSLRNAREQAKEAKCAAHLAGFGRGFYSYAGANRDYLCSGSFDPDVDNGRDGPVDKVGWIADLVNGQYAFPNDTLCPTNEARVNQKLGQGPSGSMGSTYSNGDSYASWELIDERIRRGFNSNYTQSWYMARTEMRRSGADYNTRRLRATEGPLRTTRIIHVAPAAVPLLGDGGIESADVYRGKIADLGEKTVKSMGDGPIDPKFGPQSYSDFGPAHGFGAPLSNGDASPHDRANVLFADGHVSRFIDKVRDGQFLIDYDERGVLTQQDVDSRVFDGVLSLGRRSENSFTLE